MKKVISTILSLAFLSGTCMHISFAEKPQMASANQGTTLSNSKESKNSDENFNSVTEKSETEQKEDSTLLEETEQNKSFREKFIQKEKKRLEEDKKNLEVRLKYIEELENMSDKSFIQEYVLEKVLVGTYLLIVGLGPAIIIKKLFDKTYSNGFNDGLNLLLGLTQCF